MPLRPCFALPVIVCFLALPLSSIAQHGHAPEHSWDYSDAHGPAHWGELNPDFGLCQNGHHQSPIDIQNPKITDLPPIQFNYKSAPLDIIDNGHTVMINYAPGSFISVGGKRYELKQFHFHRPSEEHVNGKTYPMSAHFVHADQEGRLAVVAVLLEQGADNPVLRELWRNLPRQKDKETILKNVQIDAAGLLPAERGYYTFDGSLTTPPCSEHVTWLVLRNPVSISAEEIEQFSKLYQNDARPTQPLYDRVVLESK